MGLMNNIDDESNKISKALLGYDNSEFVHSKEGRVIRLLAEYLYPKQQFDIKKIKRTIIFFGSARIRSEKEDVKKYRIENGDNLDIKPIIKKEIEDEIVKANRKKLSKIYDETRELAFKISSWSNKLPKEQRFYICTGGGPGIMEAANRGAKEAGTKTIGLNISLPFEQDPNQYISKNLNFEFHYFFMRKLWFVVLAKAMVVFPGGFGTFDELMEVLTLKQTRKVTKPLPIYLYHKEYWDNVFNFNYLAEYGLISKEDLNLFRYVNSPDEAFEAIVGDLSKIYSINIEK
jgi:uncharacterized protein (TIGR00730 family)